MKRCLLCPLLVALVLSCGSQFALATTFAYIPNGDGNITRVDTTDEEEIFESVVLSDSNNPFGAAVTPNGAFLLVTSSPDLIDPVDPDDPANLGTVTLIPTSNFLVAGSQIDVPVGIDPRGVAVDTRGSFAYVANFATDTLSRVNMAALSVSGDPIDVGEGTGPFGPFGVAAFYDEEEAINKVYVSNNTAGTVTVIFDDDGIATFETDIDVGTNPSGVALTPDGRFLYVANNGSDSDSVSIIQTSNNTVLTTLSLGVGTAPWGVAVGSDGEFVYVTNSGANTVSVIATSSQTVQSTFFDVNQPMGVAAPKNGDFAYVVNQGGNTITRIDMGTQTETTFGAGEISNATALGAFIGGTPPSAPNGLVAEALTFDEIELTWTDNADDELGFKIERREESEDRFIQIAKVDADVTIYSDDNLSGETTYFYRVRAFNEAADSGFATEASAVTDEGQFSWCFIQTLLR